LNPLQTKVATPLSIVEVADKQRKRVFISKLGLNPKILAKPLDLLVRNPRSHFSLKEISFATIITPKKIQGAHYSILVGIARR
jgi:hypothetical protein